MIAKLEVHPFVFSTLTRKIDYHQSKIATNKAEFVYSSLGTYDLQSFKKDCIMIASMNDRVKLPYQEVSINLPHGESLSDVIFLKLVNDYMKDIGYGQSCYAVIKHADKKHAHFHVLFTTIDIEGKRISDSNIRFRSQKVSRELELKYGLTPTIYDKFNKSSLGEIIAREYYFDRAFRAGLRSNSSKDILKNMLQDFSNIDFTPKRTNMQYEILLGDVYDRVGAILESGNHFKKLYKDELLGIMDAAYLKSSTISEFKENLENLGCYMRHVSDKGKSKYIYGITDISVYFKDTSFPIKYRFGKLNLSVSNNLSVDEQKHYIYNHVFIALKESRTYDEFIDRLENMGISAIESSNSRGVYGLSFAMNNVDNIIVFKASDVSKRFSFTNIESFFAQRSNSISKVVDNPKIIEEIYEDKIRPIYHDPGYVKDEDNEDIKRRKKRKNKDL